MLKNIFTFEMRLNIDVGKSYNLANVSFCPLVYLIKKYLKTGYDAGQ